jgi:hypothetical protein
MQSYAINSENQKVESKELQMQANTVYSFFNSILIDELLTLKDHIIYADENALSEGKKPYFIGEQLILGDALILGRNGMEDVDVSISEEELSSLVNFDIPQFYKDTLTLLVNTEINLYKTFTLQKDEESVTLNPEWILYAFNMADERTKEYFLEHLQKTINTKEDINQYLQKMAGLALNAGSK